MEYLRAWGASTIYPPYFRQARPPLADLSHKFFEKLRVKSTPGALSKNQKGQT